MYERGEEVGFGTVVRDAADLLSQLSEPLIARVLGSLHGAEASDMRKSEGSTRLFIVKQDDTADVALFIGICSFYGVAQAFDRGKAVCQLHAFLAQGHSCTSGSGEKKNTPSHQVVNPGRKDELVGQPSNGRWLRVVQ